IMLFGLFVFLQLLSAGNPASARKLMSQNEVSEDQVFAGESDAKLFLGRHLLANRFDFEMFVPGNLERECREEVCNYEEAREVFENIPQTVKFVIYFLWFCQYTVGTSSRVDVTGLLVGLICAGVVVVILGVLIWYLCRSTFKSGFSRRPRQTALSPTSGPTLDVEDPPGLPSYEQAISASGQHDAPPPPYPGCDQSQPSEACVLH
uniref:Proline rich Gla (G-carboxyglutamic acid) 4 (transmembrane) n=1 Tax=Xiphophorus couchianus TaxID=32473 RepID=A0A3B5M1S7_9TELE